MTSGGGRSIKSCSRRVQTGVQVFQRDSSICNLVGLQKSLRPVVEETVVRGEVVSKRRVLALVACARTAANPEASDDLHVTYKLHFAFPSRSLAISYTTLLMRRGEVDSNTNNTSLSLLTP